MTVEHIYFIVVLVCNPGQACMEFVTPQEDGNVYESYRDCTDAARDLKRQTINSNVKYKCESKMRRAP